MTSKTKRTLDIIDSLAPAPDLRVTSPRILVPCDAYNFAYDHAPWTDDPNPSPNNCLLFQLDYRSSR